MCDSCLSSSLLYVVSTANRQGLRQAGNVSSLLIKSISKFIFNLYSMSLLLNVGKPLDPELGFMTWGLVTMHAFCFAFPL